MKRFCVYVFAISLICSLFASPVSAASTPWVDAKEQAGIVYLLFDSPARIKRYNMIGKSWLADIVLGDIPTAFAIDSNALFISFGRRTSRFNLDGSGEVHLCNTNSDVRSLLINNDFLYVYDGNIFLSINKDSGTEIDSQEYWYTMQGLTVAPSIGMAFARNMGVSPSDIVQITLNNDGTLGEQQDSPYHGDYPGAAQTYIFPNEARVADSAGIVYNTNDLTYSNSLAGSFDDLAFYGDLPVVLRNNDLIAYSNVFLETGRYTPADPPAAIFIYGENIFSFFLNSAEAVAAAVIPVDLLSPATPGDPLDPTGLAYLPDNIILGQDETVYLLSRSNLSIFRWSVAQHDYMETIPLLAAPKYMAYSSDTDRLYLAYATNEITEIRLDQGLAETPFVNSPEEPKGLATAGPYVFVCDPSGAWVSHFTYSPEGVLISQEEWNYFSKEYIWNAANKKMYFFRDDTSPNDLLWEDIADDGLIGEYKDSPYHSSEGIQHPIRVSPDGSTVVLGSGRIYDAVTLEQVNSLSNDIVDAVWKSGGLVTLRSFNSNTQVQKWTATYGMMETKQVEGSPLGILSVDEGLLVITDVAGVPTFTIFNEAPENEPEIEVRSNGVSIAHGDKTPSAEDYTDFGGVALGTSVNRTYDIVNIGTAELSLTGSEYITLDGEGCTEFSVTTQPTSPVAAEGGTASFILRYSPTNTGEDVCTVVIANDDYDENPYHFAIKGMGLMEKNAAWLPVLYLLLL